MQQLNFPAAMKEAAELLNRMETASEAERTVMAPELEKFMSGEESCRGFFVVLLTDDRKIADEPPAVLVDAIKKGGDIAASVLARNLVMSAATKVVHQRKGDTENAEGSAHVTKRTQELIRKMNSDPMRQKLAEMRASLRGESQEFAPFMARVNYDTEQIQVALTAIDTALL